MAYKVCKCCGQVYKTEKEFLSKTKFIGIQRFDPYNIFNLELRDCKCQTTLARKLSNSEVRLTPSIAFAC